MGVSTFMQSLANLIKGFAMLIVTAVVGLMGYLGYSAYNSHFRLDTELKQKEVLLAANQLEISKLKGDVVQQAKRIDQLDLANRLLKVDHRLAEMKVDKQWTSEATQKLMTQFAFVEVDDQDQPIGDPKTFTIQGDIVHVDALVVHYLDKFIEAGDPLRGSAVCLFKRVYGEFQEPSQGFPLDSAGSRPAIYGRGGKMPEFEKEIWDNFWNYANDPKKAQSAGVRTAQGEGPYTRLEKGKLYKVQLRSSGGLSIVAEELPAGTADPS